MQTLSPNSQSSLGRNSVRTNAFLTKIPDFLDVYVKIFNYESLSFACENTQVDMKDAFPLQSIKGGGVVGLLGKLRA